jgi:hypothetical protein
LGAWNQHLAALQFNWAETMASWGSYADGNNSVFFSHHVFGESFGANTLAVTVVRRSDDNPSVMVEADVIFNNASRFDSYRGPVQQDPASGAYVFDFQRVALHEFGHVLGLDHPDQRGQPGVAAIMRSTIGDLDHLTADDIAGAAGLYGQSTVTAPLGASFHFRLRASNNPSSFAVTNLPPGLSVNASGIITGVPTISGEYTVEVTAIGQPANVSFTMRINVPAPVIRPAGNFGDLIQTMKLGAWHLGADPSRPRMYMSSHKTNSITVVNTDSMVVVKSIPTVSSPLGLNVSRDGKRLFVAGWKSNEVGVIDLNSLEQLPGMAAPSALNDVVQGEDGRVFATPIGSYGIYHFDGGTGALLGRLGYESGLLQMSGDGRSLFSASDSSTPIQLVKYDVATAPGSVVARAPFNTYSGVLTGFAATHDGRMVCVADGGSSTRFVRGLSTADLTTELVRFTAPDDGVTRGAIAFSPDDRVLYMLSQNIFTSKSLISAFDAATGALLASFPAPAVSYMSDMAVDNSGRYLFVTARADATDAPVYVYATGRSGVTSSTAAMPARRGLANVSTRMRTEPGERSLIGGFIIDGAEPKRVIVRAIGTSLAISGRLADPRLTLLNSSGDVVAENDNWNSHRGDVIGSGVPPKEERESAIVAKLEPGAYTVVVGGVGETSGTAVVELYDIGGDTASRLANISSRGRVGTGEDVMIGGFILAGQESRKVVVRAVGPSLLKNGVADALLDPMLSLHDANGAVIAENDEWRQSQEAEISECGLALSDDREAAIVRSLAAGAYTAVVRGKGGTTGVGLVEVYDLATP